MPQSPIDPERFREIAALLRRWSANEPLLRTEENELFEVAARIVMANYLTRKRLAAVAMRVGVELADAARDYIMPMFGREPNGEVQNWLAINLGGSLRKDDAVLIADWRALTITFVRQDLFHRWGEFELLEARVWRNMWSALRNDRIYQLWPNDSPRWVTLISWKNLNLERPEITFEEALGEIMSLSSGCKTLPPLIRATVDRIVLDGRWRAGIRIEEVLYESLCDVARQGILDESSLRHDSEELSPDLKLAVERAHCSGMMKARPIICNYLTEEKLDERMSCCFEKAIGHLMTDFGLTGIWQGGYCEYLRQCCPELTDQAYRRNYKARFDHVAIVAQRAFLDKLREELAD